MFIEIKESPESPLIVLNSDKIIKITVVDIADNEYVLTIYLQEGNTSIAHNYYFNSQEFLWRAYANLINILEYKRFEPEGMK